MTIKFANTVNQSLVFKLWEDSRTYTVGFYSGTQPANAEFMISNWSSGNNYRANYLGGFQSGLFQAADLTQTNTTGLIAANSYVTLNSTKTFTAAGTGTCEWAVLFATSITLSASYSWNNNYQVIVVPVTDSVTPGGLFRVDSTSFVSGSLVTVTDFTFISTSGEP